MPKEEIWEASTPVPKTRDEFFHKFTSPERAMRKAVEEGRVIQVDVELNNTCYGSCAYCYSSSHPKGDSSMPTEKVLQLIDQLAELGVRQLTWPGGDPFYHPDCFRIWRYAGEKGLRNFPWTSGLPITKKVAQQICQEPSIRMIGFHIDSIDPQVYARVHRDPKGLEGKLRGYRNLLEAGFPPERVFGCICITKPAIEGIEATLEWFIDEMGVKFVDMPAFRPLGYGASHKEWEPSREEVQRACEYRAKKLGENFLRFGPMECSRFFCQSYFIIDSEGLVHPCGQLPHLVAGSVFEKSIKEIYQENHEMLLFKFQVKGYCGQCENKDVCFGCRANAYYYTGDVQASDPKCWLNPEARTVR